MARMIFRVLEIMPFGTNCYLVASENTRDGMVIDPAADAPRIMNNIRELNLKIGLIVVTHTHGDHTGALGQLVESTGAKFAVHAAEAENMARYGVPVPDRLLQDGDILTVGDLTFQVLHTPGHSPGGICIAGSGVVFSGDALFNMSVGRTDFPGGDHNLLISGIKNKLLVLPDQTLVLPGHGPRTTIGYEKKNNPFLQ
jgi:hydroxyacylglutathione hydrolase